MFRKPTFLEQVAKATTLGELAELASVAEHTREEIAVINAALPLVSGAADVAALAKKFARPDGRHQLVQYYVEMGQAKTIEDASLLCGALLRGQSGSQAADDALRIMVAPLLKITAGDSLNQMRLVINVASSLAFSTSLHLALAEALCTHGLDQFTSYQEVVVYAHALWSPLAHNCLLMSYGQTRLQQDKLGLAGVLDILASVFNPQSKSGQRTRRAIVGSLKPLLRQDKPTFEEILVLAGHILEEDGEVDVDSDHAQFFAEIAMPVVDTVSKAVEVARQIESFSVAHVFLAQYLATHTLENEEAVVAITLCLRNDEPGARAIQETLTGICLAQGFRFRPSVIRTMTLVQGTTLFVSSEAEIPEDLPAEAWEAIQEALRRMGR